MSTPWTIAKQGIHYFRRREVFILEGRERSGGRPLCVAVAGSLPLKDYLAKIAFEGTVTQRLLARVPAWSIPALVKRLSPECALLAWKIPPFLGIYFARDSFARLPWWVDMRIDLQGTPPVFHTKHRFLSLEKIVASQGFTAESARDEAAVFDFYHDLYVPYIRNRHGVHALVRPYAQTREAVMSGRWELMLLKRAGQALGGATIDISGPTVRAIDFGVRDGSQENLQQGVAGGLYYFLLTRLRERGIETLDIGNCHPFVSDGVFRYKMSLGAYLFEPDIDNGGVIDLQLLQLTAGLQDFVVNNSFIELEGRNQLKLNVVVKNLDASAQSHFEAMRRRYCFKGTVSARLVSIPDLFP
ncbi:MAG: hypothetical protein AAB036_08905 [Elusimicrobiota bacterium]